jgi:hypothetical protein
MELLSQIAFELVELHAGLEAAHDSTVVGALVDARAAVQRERLRLEAEVESVRDDHAVGALDDDRAAQRLHALDDERLDLADEESQIEQVWIAWVRRRAPLDDPDMVARLEEFEGEERRRRLAAPPDPPTPPPMWDPITDEEIAGWRRAVAEQLHRRSA